MLKKLLQKLNKKNIEINEELEEDNIITWDILLRDILSFTNEYVTDFIMWTDLEILNTQVNCIINFIARSEHFIYQPYFDNDYTKNRFVVFPLSEYAENKIEEYTPTIH